MANVGDPVAAGFVASLAHPGGMSGVQKNGSLVTVHTALLKSDISPPSK